MLRTERSLPQDKNNYYNLQIDSFINHAILNKTTIKSNTRLTNSVPNIGYQVYELQILVSVKKIIVVIEKQRNRVRYQLCMRNQIQIQIHLFGHIADPGDLC